MIAQLSIILIFFGFFYSTEAVECLDCIGSDCMDEDCEGEYCVLSHYTPRWGTERGDPSKVVKGCLSGSMLRKDFESHCEVADESDKVTLFFSNNKFRMC